MSQPLPIESKVGTLQLAVSKAAEALTIATGKRDGLLAALNEAKAVAKGEFDRAEGALTKAQEAFDSDPSKRDAFLKAQAARDAARSAPKADLDRAERLVSKAGDEVNAANAALDAANDALGGLLLSNEYVKAREAPIFETLLAARRLLMQAWADHRALTVAIGDAVRQHPRVLLEDDGEGGKRRRRPPSPALMVLDARVRETLTAQRHEISTPEGLRLKEGESFVTGHVFEQARFYATGGG